MIEIMAIDAVEVLNPIGNAPLPEGPEGNSPKKNNWGYTRMAEDRVAQHFVVENDHDGKLKEIGFYEGRRLIGRDRPIDKGVYLTAGYGEAIVVDGEKYPLLKSEYEKLKAELEKKAKIDNNPLKSYVLTGVYERARKLMKYDSEGVEKIHTSLGISTLTNKPVKISLTVFLEKKVGVCRHQALLVGYFLEQFKKDGVTRGNVSVDRNWVEDQGHAWVRYVNSEGKIFIIDPAQNYIGALDDIKQKEQWLYKRDQDQ